MQFSLNFYVGKNSCDRILLNCFLRRPTPKKPMSMIPALLLPHLAMDGLRARVIIPFLTAVLHRELVVFLPVRRSRCSGRCFGSDTCIPFGIFYIPRRPDATRHLLRHRPRRIYAEVGVPYGTQCQKLIYSV
jgi:hypothetical protein